MCSFVCQSIHVEVGGQLERGSLFPCFVGLGDWTQVVRLKSRCLFQLSHLFDPGPRIWCNPWRCVSHGDIVTAWQKVPSDKWRSSKVTCWGNSKAKTRNHCTHPWFSALSNTSLLPAVRWRENQMVWQTVLVAVKSAFLSALTGSSYLPSFGRVRWWKWRQVEEGKQSARFFMWHKCPISSRFSRKKQGKCNE